MAHYHPLTSRPATFPAIAAAFVVAIIAFTGLWALLQMSTPPTGLNPYTDSPVLVNLQFLTSMWRSVWATAPTVSTIGSMAEFLIHIVSRPITILTAVGALTPCLILLIAAVVAGERSFAIVY